MRTKCFNPRCGAWNVVDQKPSFVDDVIGRVGDGKLRCGKCSRLIIDGLYFFKTPKDASPDRWQVEIQDGDSSEPDEFFMFDNEGCAMEKADEVIKLLERYGAEELIDGIYVLVIHYGQGGQGDPDIKAGWECGGEIFTRLEEGKIKDLNNACC